MTAISLPRQIAVDLYLKLTRDPIPNNGPEITIPKNAGSNGKIYLDIGIAQMHLYGV